MASLCVIALVALTGCGDKRPEKKAPTSGSATAQKQRPSPKDAAMEAVLMWDASVQKMGEEVARAEAAGDTATAEAFREKLKISKMGAVQARKKLQMLERAEAQARAEKQGSSTTP